MRSGPRPPAARRSPAFGENGAEITLVILDLGLPDLDGLEVCRRIRAGGAGKDLPVLMLTARTDEADFVVGLDAGADDYVCQAVPDGRAVGACARAAASAGCPALMEIGGVRVEGTGSRRVGGGRGRGHLVEQGVRAAASDDEPGRPGRHARGDPVRGVERPGR